MHAGCGRVRTGPQAEPGVAPDGGDRWRAYRGGQSSRGSGTPDAEAVVVDSGYGLWFLVVLNSVIFILFATSFFHPRSRRDWKAMGAFSAFVVELFTEM